MERLPSDLAEVFQYDGDVHVDDDEKRDDEIGDQVEDRHPGVAAVAVRFHVSRRVVTVGRVDHESSQHAVPSG